MNVLLNDKNNQIKNICINNDIRYMALFGSNARGQAAKDSDVDLLVEFYNTPGLIKFINIKHQLEDLIGTKVDLVTKKGLSKNIFPYIQNDLQVIYEEK